jgi:photosystem II stability/assembly factor-like uncharacterized protein
MKKIFTILAMLSIFASVNAQGWVNQTSGVSTSLRHVYFVDAQNGWCVGAGGVFLKTTDGGTNWQKNNIANNSLLIGCYMQNSTTGCVGGDNGIYNTTDGGLTWGQTPGTTNVTKIDFVDSQIGFAVGGESSSNTAMIYKTTNGGSSWSTILNTHDYSRLYGVIFYDANIGCAYDEKGLFIKTTDGGATWVKKSTGVTGPITAMRFLDLNTGFLSGHNETTGYILKTTNSGETWTVLYDNLTYALSDIFGGGSSTLWATAGNPTGSFICKSTDHGDTWNNVLSTGTKGWQSLFFVSEDLGWVVSSEGDIMQYNGTPSAIDGKSNEMPIGYSLQQNYPNPFNPSTEIRYSLPNESSVKISVYNIAGALISELFSGIKEAGNHTLNFNAKGLSSGIYIYTITANSTDGKQLYRTSRKMTLLK